MSTYKEAKEAFVSGGAGTSHLAINGVAAIGLASYALALASSSFHKPSPIIDYITQVLPLLLGLTVFSGHPWKFVALLAGGAILLLNALALPSSAERGKGHDENRRRRSIREDDTSEEEQEEEAATQEDKKSSPNTAVGADRTDPSATPSSTTNRLASQPFLTVYRAHMMIITVLAILAVDFPVFPRGFGKTELWGTSLMDIGVGSFVMSLGIVAARPLLSPPLSSDPPLGQMIFASLRKVLPTLLLGLIRVIMVKGVDYPEHETEYGRHWNFFWTIGLLPPFACIFHRLTPYASFAGLGILLSIGHQVLLSFGGLEEWVLNAPRVSFISQNKEGLVSFPGYLAIFLIGLDLGQYVLPLSASTAYRAVRPRPGAKQRPEKLVPVLLGYVAVWWTLLWGSTGFGNDAQGVHDVSRRMANLPYVLWSAAFNTTFLFGYLLVQLAFLGPSTRTKGGAAAASMMVPPLIQAANKNPLVVFLFANLFTGLVNVSIRSLDQGPVRAIGILVLYSGTVYGLAWAIRGRRIA